MVSEILPFEKLALNVCQCHKRRPRSSKGIFHIRFDSFIGPTKLPNMKSISNGPTSTGSQTIANIRIDPKSGGNFAVLHAYVWKTASCTTKSLG